MYANGDTINGLLIFKIFVVISSYPHELLLFNYLINFSISPVVVFFSLIFVKIVEMQNINNLTGHYYLHNQ